MHRWFRPRSNEARLGVVSSRKAIVDWESPEPIARAIRKLSTGHEDLCPVAGFVDRLGHFRSIAVFDGSGGALALPLVLAHPEALFDVFLTDAAAFEHAREQARVQGLASERCRLRVVDWQSPDFGEGGWDALVSVGALYGAVRPDEAMAALSAALQPEALALFIEYAGPRRFQWNDTQMRLADELLCLVPEHLRLRNHVARNAPSAVADGRHSEAAGSDALEAALSAWFETIECRDRGGTLLAPIFGSGCVDAAICDDEDGRAVLAGLYEAERALIDAGVVGSDHRLWVVRPRRTALARARHRFAEVIGPDAETAERGISGDLGAWLDLNRRTLPGTFWAERVAPFPDVAPMRDTTGLTAGVDFASHGIDIVGALAEAAAPAQLADFRELLDFGVGVGRVARLFRGFRGRYTGVDIDATNIAWVRRNLPWVEAVETTPSAALPFPYGRFDAVVSISVFTHLTLADQRFALEELHRVTMPGARLLVTIAGARVLDRAATEPAIADLMSLRPDEITAARRAFDGPEGFGFVEQETHLTRPDFRYGMAFVSPDHVRREWSRYFVVEGIRPAAIHDFQDMVVLRRV